MLNSPNANFDYDKSYFGIVESKDGISLDPTKIEVVTKCERPTTVIEVQSFLGLAGYYRRFV